MSKDYSNPIKQLRNRIFQSDPKKIIIGAGDMLYSPDFICTNVEEFDVTSREDWEFLFEDSPYPVGVIDVLFAEHAWEYLTEEQAIIAARNAFDFLKPGGTFRVAVPDGNFPDQKYIDQVGPGGSMGYKVLWNYLTLSKVFEDAGFEVVPLEFWSAGGDFHYRPWDLVKGKVLRSLLNDDRNSITMNEGNQPTGNIGYTSVILDAIKPGIVKSNATTGLVKQVRMRDIEGERYVNIDDFISVLTLAIDANEGDLKKGIQGVRANYMKFAAEIESVAYESQGQYAEEKLVKMKSMIMDVTDEIERVGEDSVSGKAHFYVLTFLTQLNKQQGSFSDN